jgi:hypothetical protein
MTSPEGRTYGGSRPFQVGPGEVVRIEPDGTETPLDPRHDLACHSPDGFQWGYGGSGPAQLALALVADATGDDKLALRTYQRFKFEIVTGLPNIWRLDAVNIAEFAKALDRDPAERSVV